MSREHDAVLPRPVRPCFFQRFFLRKHPLPSRQSAAAFGYLRSEGIWHLDFGPQPLGGSRSWIVFDLLEVFAGVGPFERIGATFVICPWRPLPSRIVILISREVDGTDPQSEAFHEPQPRKPYMRLGHQPFVSLQKLQDRLYFLRASSPRGYGGVCAARDHLAEVADLPTQHVAIKEKQSTEGLVLRRGAYFLFGPPDG